MSTEEPASNLAGLFTGRQTCEHGSLINTLSVRDDAAAIWASGSPPTSTTTRPTWAWHVRAGATSRGLLDMTARSPRPGRTATTRWSTIRAFEGYLMGRAPGRPFFAVVSLYNPHGVRTRRRTRRLV